MYLPGRNSEILNRFNAYPCRIGGENAVYLGTNKPQKKIAAIEGFTFMILLTQYEPSGLSLLDFTFSLDRCFGGAHSRDGIRDFGQADCSKRAFQSGTCFPWGGTCIVSLLCSIAKHRRDILGAIQSDGQYGRLFAEANAEHRLIGDRYCIPNVDHRHSSGFRSSTSYGRAHHHSQLFRRSGRSWGLFATDSSRISRTTDVKDFYGTDEQR